MNELIAKIRAALEADEIAAGAATSGPWENGDAMARDGVYAAAVDGYIADCDYEQMGPFAVFNATHIARHDPARVLRQVAAMRKILELLPDVETAEGWMHQELSGMDGIPDIMQPLVEALAEACGITP